ncbi:MAG: LamG-like jellyroll fold domain-containing protein [Promethearchaeota archaeon]
MKTKNKKSRMVFSISLLLIFLISSGLTLFPQNSINSENINDVSKSNDKTNLKSTLKNAALGEDAWWNSSFTYRRLINITNPHAVDLVDTIVSITFNYSDYVNAGKMNSTLKDVRIIENNTIRNYIIQIDYPNASLATVWFETNLSASSLELDTYMYYGNDTVGMATAYYNKNSRFGTNWWRLDEDMPGPYEAEDSIGNINGDFQNTPTYVTDGKVGGSVDLDGNVQDDHIHFDGFYCGDTLIVAGWTKGGGSGQMPWSIDRNSGTDMDPYHSGGFIYNNRGDGSGNPYYDELSQRVPYPTDGEWHHYVWENIGGSIQTSKFWIDGQLAGTAFYNNPTSTSRRFQISSWPINDNYHWNGEIDDVRIFQYGLSTYDVESIYNLSAIPAELNEEQYKGIIENLVLTVYDVDGRFVPNAYLSLVNMSVPEVYTTGKTGDDGSVTFKKVPAGTYNITVKYNDTSSGMEYLAYNSTEENFGTPDADMYTFTYIRNEMDVYVNLWTIDFEIVDWDNNPLGYSYVNVSDSPTNPVIDHIRLIDGKGTFVWKNQSQYYYNISYDNEDYNSTIPIHLNESYVYRDTYDALNEKYYNHIILVNQSNIMNPPGSEYRVIEYIYTNGSTTDVSNKRLLQANITIEKMTDFLDTVKIYYLDEDGNWDDNSLIYFNDSYSGGQEDFISINIRDTPEESINLINDNFQAYGLLIDVRGFNSTTLTQCNGTILVETVETCNIYNKTSMAKLQIRVIDTSDEIIPVQSCIVKVKNSTGDSITNLITDSEGYAHGQINSESDFWYVRNPTENYTFSLNFYGGSDKNFLVNKTDQYDPSPSLVNHYNYSLRFNTSLVFKLLINIDDYQSMFIDYSGDTAVIWGSDMTFSVNFTIKAGVGANWVGLDDPDEIICTIGGIKSYDMNFVTDGVFTVTIPSYEFSAGNNYEIYSVEITGSKLGYVDPIPIFAEITINSRPTGMSIHDYETLDELESNSISEYYDELINITLKYYDASNNNSLTPESFTYDWDYGSGTLSPDPINSEYYILELDTSVVENVGTYHLEFTARRENYTEIVNFDFFITILTRPTSTEDSTGIVYVSESIYIFEELNFSFDYTDVLRNSPISNLDEMSYIMQELDENGDPIQGTSEIGSLIPIGNEFVLDLDTELRHDGEYSVIVTLAKKNYEYRIAIVSLTILERIIDIGWPELLLDSKIEIDAGKTLQFSIDLTDPNNNSAPIIGASVYLTLGDETYVFTDNGDGSYIVNIPAISNPFFVPETFTATLTIEKQYFETKSSTITIVVNMQEIFGFPTFYFVMIIGSIIAVAGSLTAYRIVQQRRIPTFVKKSRSMKKSIKGNKIISDSLLYPSKEEFIVKKLGDKWDSIGLSLEDIMGVKEKKKMKLPEVKEEFKGGAD